DREPPPVSHHYRLGRAVRPVGRAVDRRPDWRRPGRPPDASGANRCAAQSARRPADRVGGVRRPPLRPKDRAAPRLLFRPGKGGGQGPDRRRSDPARPGRTPGPEAAADPALRGHGLRFRQPRPLGEV
ncbi:MAG: hypothetical protein AVDCRST_MAG73-1251, partial [uncultured Thermomicrobiales bacterium]